MVLHISISGKESDHITKKLYEYYKNKNYKTRMVQRLDHKPIHNIIRHYNLLPHEQALIHSLDESLTYHMENWKQYEIVLWSGSILDDYLKLYNHQGVTDYWLKQINKFNQKKDLYIYITNDNDTIKNNPANNLQNTLIIKQQDNTDNLFNELIKQINEYFTHCKWCNHIYKKHDNNLYCSKTCRELAYQKQVRDAVNRFRKKNRNNNASDYHSNLGSEALLKQHPNEDFTKEHRIILNEKRRLGL